MACSEGATVDAIMSHRSKGDLSLDSAEHIWTCARHEGGLRVLRC
jgi:hypothetical protein